MKKDIIGDWGSSLSDGDYACALAALGALEASRPHAHQPNSDLSRIVSFLAAEFERGERTPVWRRDLVLQPTIDQQAWNATQHADPLLLATAWRNYRQLIPHARQVPRFALPLSARARADLFSFDSLCEWLSHYEVGLGSLVLADSPPAYRWRTSWHRPLRVGILPGPTNSDFRMAWDAAANIHVWMLRLAEFFTVGTGRDACDVLFLTRDQAGWMLGDRSSRVRANLVVCLENYPANPGTTSDLYVALRSHVRAAGVAAIGALDLNQISDWFEAFLREVSHDVPAHAALYHTRLHGIGRLPFVVGDPKGLDQCRLLAMAARRDAVLESLLQTDVGIDLGIEEPDSSDGMDGGAGAEADEGDDSLPDFGSFGRPDSGSSGRDLGGSDGLPEVSASPASAEPGDWLVYARRRLADEIRQREFSSENKDGTLAVDELEQIDEQIRTARAPRWIQAKAWKRDSPSMPARALPAGEWCLLGIHIGPSLIRRADACVPDSDLDFSSNDVAITAQVELAGASIDALTAAEFAVGQKPGEQFIWPSDMQDPNHPPAALLLRGPLAKRAPPAVRSKGTQTVGLASTTIPLPAAGDSALALFPVWLHESTQRIEGRIAIIHANRILQTARISLAPDALANQGDGVIVTAEATLHSAEEDVDERRNYDATIQVSDLGGKLHLVIQRDGISHRVQLDALEEPITQICRALTGLAFAMNYSQPMLGQQAFIDTIYTMAAHGASLRQHLWETCGKDDIDAWQRIHLVPTTNQFLPLEYVYDGEPPQVDAGVCPNMFGALERGGCELGADTPSGPGVCPNHRDSAYTCPLHFWGFRRVIERSARVNDAPVNLPAAVIRCTPAKQRYGTVKTILLGASDRAFMYATSSGLQAEKALLNASFRALSQAFFPADNWNDWRDEVAKSPNLLVLLAHTAQHKNVPVLEIGNQALLGRHEIGTKITGASSTPQLLILLGCSAAQVTQDFQPYPERFSAAGVKIVLAPIAPIRGADAVPIAKHLAKLMAECSSRPDPTAFGDLLPLLRRQLLREGHPGVMGIVGFGDGDWLMGGA